jgi:hypothetical protein
MPVNGQTGGDAGKGGPWTGWGVPLAILLLGLGLRNFHYLRGPVVWGDEAAVMVNVRNKDYAGLLGPLALHQAAPPLFLWAEKAVSLRLGDGPAAMRLLPWLASCLALLLMADLCRRLLPPRAAAWVLLFFACSDQLSYHACEAKPYALDVLAAALLPFLLVHGERLTRVGLLLAYTLLAPLLIWLSYPACFLYGGVLAALLPAGRRDRRPGVIAAYAGLAVTVAVAFLALALGPQRAQREPWLVGFWAEYFPNWRRPWAVPWWVTLSTLEVSRYCCKPHGQAMAVLAFVGGVMFWKRGRRDLVVLLALPVGLALLGSCLHRYPYGGVRVMVFAAPALLLLAGAAVPSVLAWLRGRSRLAAAVLVLFLLLPAAAAAKRVFFPWQNPDPASAAAFVQAHRRPDDPVTGNDWTHLYYFRHLGSAFHWPEDSPARPTHRLWVVWTDWAPPEKRLLDAWRLAPFGWWPVERFDSLYTTAALFCKWEPPASARRTYRCPPR